MVKLTSFAIALFVAAIALVAMPAGRAQAPSSYDLHVLPPGATLRLEIDGVRVRVSVNGKDELALVDAKGSPVAGGIGLWVGIGTEGYFSNLRVTPR